MVVYVFQRYSLNTPQPLLPSPHPRPDLLWPFSCGPSLTSACMPVQQTRHYHFIVRILPLSPQPLLFLPKSWSFAHLSPLTPADDVHLQLQIQKLYYTVTYCQSRALASGRPGWGFPGGASGKEPTCQCRRCKRRGFSTWVGKIPWRRTWPPTPVSLPGELHGQRSLVGYDL